MNPSLTTDTPGGPIFPVSINWTGDRKGSIPCTTHSLNETVRVTFLSPIQWRKASSPSLFGASKTFSSITRLGALTPFCPLSPLTINPFNNVWYLRRTLCLGYAKRDPVHVQCARLLSMYMFTEIPSIA